MTQPGGLAVATKSLLAGLELTRHTDTLRYQVTLLRCGPRLWVALHQPASTGAAGAAGAAAAPPPPPPLESDLAGWELRLEPTRLCADLPPALPLVLFAIAEWGRDSRPRFTLRRPAAAVERSLLAATTRERREAQGQAGPSSSAS